MPADMPSKVFFLPHLLRATLTFITFVSVVATMQVDPNMEPRLAKRKSCETDLDCYAHDPNKECINGQCHCKPYFEDNLVHDDICRRSYKSTCNSSLLCNANKFLTCGKEEVCDCSQMQEQDMIYDNFQEKCVAKLKNVCELIGFVDIKVECVRNAKCVQDPKRKEDNDYFGICACDPGFVQKGERCVPELGAPCELDVDCDDVGVVCKNGFCACSNDRIYNETEQDCMLKVLADCEMEEDSCVENSSCVYKIDTANGDRKCLCNRGYHATKNGTCVQDKSEDCGDKLKIYDEKKEACATRVGNDCLTNGPNRCVSHAFCGNKNKCQCFEGYVVSEGGKCIRSSSSTMPLSLAPSTNPNSRVGSSGSATGFGPRIRLSLVVLVLANCAL